MQTLITSGVAYAQLLEDVRAIIRYEVSTHQMSAGPGAPTEAAGPELLTVRDAAELLDVCQQTVHDWKRRGLLPYHKIGGRTYLKRSDVLAALQAYQRTSKPTGPARRHRN